MSKPRRVAIVAFSAPPTGAGGVASAQYNLFRALQSQGFEARLFTFGDPNREDGEIARRGSPAWFVKLIRWLSKWVFAILDPGKTSLQTRDILISQPGAWRMNRAMRAFDPEVIVLSDHGAPGLQVRKRRGAHIILTMHHNPARFSAHPVPPVYSQLDVRWALALERRVLPKVDVMVCPSHYMLEWVRSSHPFSGPIHVIHNLIDAFTLERAEAGDVRARLDLPADALVVYIPSPGLVLKGAKYVPRIVRQLAELSEQPLGFYLPGEIEKRYRGDFAVLKEEAAIYAPGQISYEEHIGLVKNCSFGISPSLVENFSMAILEAVLMGVPMLVFDTGGNADIISPGENGLLVGLGDVQALCDHALELFDGEKLEAFKRRTQIYSQDALDPQRSVQAYVDLIRSL